MVKRPVPGKKSELRTNFPQSFTVRQVNITEGGGGGGGGGDADTLNGQPGSFYRNRTNHTGTQNINTTTTGTLADNRLTSNVMLWSDSLYTGSGANNLNFPVGHIIPMQVTGGYPRNSVVSPRLDTTLNIGGILMGYIDSGAGSLLSGTWAVRAICGLGEVSETTIGFVLCQRIA